VHAHHIKPNQSLVTMEQSKKATYASNTPIIVPSKAVDLKHEHEMVVESKFNHTLLQDKLLSCKHSNILVQFQLCFLCYRC
jgi:hypothetical protein